MSCMLTVERQPWKRVGMWFYPRYVYWNDFEMFHKYPPSGSLWTLCIVTYHKLCCLACRLTFLLSLARWCLEWKKQKFRKPQCLNHWVCELSFCLNIMNCVSFFISFFYKCNGLNFEGLAIEDVMSAKLVQQLMKMNWGLTSLQIA